MRVVRRNLSRPCIPNTQIIHAPISAAKSINRHLPNIKRTYDVGLASVAVLGLLPVILVIYGLIRCCGFNQPIFTQKRVGQNGQVFTIFKFRTLPENTMATAVFRPLAGHWCQPILSLLRRSGLDELPQLFNVLRGDMSLVGPRPHMISDHIHFAAIHPDYEKRLIAKPGLTGWAQIRGWRGTVGTHHHLAERVAHDLDYVANQNLLFDLKILIGTVLMPFHRPKKTATCRPTKQVL